MNALPINIPPGQRYGRSSQYASQRGAGGAGRGVPRATVLTAQLAAPPPERPAPPRSATPERQVALALPPPMPRPQTPHGGFRLVPVANAEPLPERRGGPRTGAWAIQLGAFSEPGMAHAALDTAKAHARDSLDVARPLVASVRERNHTLYRARMTGLSRESAVSACERLRGHGACIVLSPEAQS
jgi:hypothetical protein